MDGIHPQKSTFHPLYIHKLAQKNSYFETS
jgi:hypothetical protein